MKQAQEDIEFPDVLACKTVNDEQLWISIDSITAVHAVERPGFPAI